MNSRYAKRLSVVAVLTLGLLILGFRIVKKPHSSPSILLASPSPLPSPAAVSALPTSTAIAALVPADAQAKITWSSTKVEVILSPGETSSRNLTFRSSQTLQNIVIEAVPKIAPFLTIQPSSFANVPANQPQSVRISLSIPTGITLGIYEGTIHVRVGTQTLPQTLKLSMRVWETFSSSSLNVSFLFPPGWEIGERNTPVPNDPTQLIIAAKSPQGSNFLVLPQGEEGYDLNDQLIETVSTVAISGFNARRRDFRLPDGNVVLTRIELTDAPNAPEYRVEFRVNNPLDLPDLESILRTLTISL